MDVIILLQDDGIVALCLLGVSLYCHLR